LGNHFPSYFSHVDYELSFVSFGEKVYKSVW
jgi:hypothetical protein